ncbi:response regulator transcription factor [Flavobacterium sp.]|uniref:response regulator transcription factor n=1 Tax=Flavobacterium sp. TaxID=239 RepID=UPI000BFF7EDA|nr:transcriptional regulator [Nostoc linckia z16]
MKILLIEDEEILANSIRGYLTGNGWLCEYVSSARLAMDKISSYEYDCILLDIGLPDGNGLAILSELKRKRRQDGVIIITAKGGLEQKIEGFSIGADDYLTKPFDLPELVMRIHALVRRRQFHGSDIITYNEISVDIAAKKVSVNGIAVDITRKEIGLLLYLIANESKVLSKSTIAEHLSGDMADMLDNHHFVYAHIKNLKRKLGEAGYGDYIKTVYGMGYKWAND